MTYKGLGALLIFVTCGSFGFSLAAAARKEEKLFRQIIDILNWMDCELQYRLTPLPELCRQAAKNTSGMIYRILTDLAFELEQQICPDVESCMGCILAGTDGLPGNIHRVLRRLGQCLGQFDLPGQLKELDAIKGECRLALEALNTHKEERLRGYQTLGLCTGAALIILLI